MRRPGHHPWLLPVGLGASDGILNALILASGSLVHSSTAMTFALAARVSAAALLSAVFTYFVAEYADLRSQLRRAERQLNITTSGHLATGHLGRQVLRDAARSTAAVGVCSVAGALAPLLLAAAIPTVPWVSLGVAIGALGALGTVLAHAIGGNAVRWTTLMMIAGAILAAIGAQLDIV